MVPKASKTLFSLALILVTCLSFMIVAETTTDDISDGATSTISDPLPCGTDAKYTFDSSTKELVIKGTGTIIHQTAWNSLGIIKVKIDNGIREIGPRSFQNIKTITEVTFPDTLKKIGYEAFSGCSNLRYPQFINVNVIENAAFYGCTALGLDAVHSSDIGDNAFTGCSSIRTIDIRSNSVGNNSFKNCTTLSKLDITCKFIKSYAFDGCTSLKTVNVSNSHVQDQAFRGCSAVKNLTIGHDVSLEKDALSGMSSVSTIKYSSTSPNGCPFNSVDFAKYSNECTLTISSNTIKKDFLKDCQSIDNVVIEYSVQKIEENAFLQTNLKKIFFNSNHFDKFDRSPFSTIYSPFDMEFSCKNIPAYVLDSAYVKNISLKEGSKVSSIGEFAFRNTDANIDMQLIKGADGKIAIGAYAFFNVSGSVVLESATKNGCTVVFNDDSMNNVRGNILIKTYDCEVEVHDRAFENSLISSIDDMKMTIIGNNAFSNCNYLSSVSLGGSIEKLGSMILSDCNSLNKVTFKCPNAQYKHDTFKDLGYKTHFEFDDNILHIPSYLLYDSKSSVYLHPDIIDIGSYALANCYIINQTNEKMVNLQYIDEAAFANSIFMNGFFPSSDVLRMIEDQAFQNSTISCIEIGPSVSRVGSNAFLHCDYVSEIHLDNNKVSFAPAGNSIFSDVGSKTAGIHASFGPNLKNLPTELFEGQSKLKTIDLENVENIGFRSFANTGIESVVLPDSLKKIGDKAFEGCIDLTKIDFQNPNVTLGKNTFKTTTEHLDTYIDCQRHSTAAEYPWADDKRDNHMNYSHVDGEYDGMMSVIFNILETIVGKDVANDIIDFFFDNVALNIMESIDLGSDEKNAALLIGIAVALLILLFVFVYIDVSEGIRVMEIILALGATMVIALNSVRLLVEYPDWYSYLSILVMTGMLAPLFSGLLQIRSKRNPRINETLLRLYSLDNTAIKDVATGPWRLMFHFADRDVEGYGFLNKIPRFVRILIAAVMIPFGLPLSAVYTLSFAIVHLPAYVFSWILVKAFNESDDLNGKHVSHCICPTCGNAFPKTYYVCECGMVHKDLSSGKYGIHKAICGNPDCHRKIKCGYKNRRWETATAICPICESKLDIGEAEPFAVSMVGASGSGKTSIAKKAFEYITECQNLQTVLPNDTTQEIVSQNAVHATDSKEKFLYTCIFREISNEYRKGLYVYDIGGKSYLENGSEIKGPVEYDFADGIILMINPYDLEQFNEDRGIAPNNVDENLILSSFVNRYMNIAETDYDDKIRTPIAVVVSRSNETGLRESSLEDVYDQSNDSNIREFLVANGLDAFLNNLSLRFSTVRMFSFENNSDSESAIVPFEWIITVNNPKMKNLLR